MLLRPTLVVTAKILMMQRIESAEFRLSCGGFGNHLQATPYFATPVMFVSTRSPYQLNG
jgi:hypothetical protein